MCLKYISIAECFFVNHGPLKNVKEEERRIRRRIDSIVRKGQITECVNWGVKIEGFC